MSVVSLIAMQLCKLSDESSGSNSWVVEPRECCRMPHIDRTAIVRSHPRLSISGCHELDELEGCRILASNACYLTSCTAQALGKGT
jgi:hypothetical protein